MNRSNPSQDRVEELKPCPFCGVKLRLSSTGRNIYWHSGVVTDRDCIMAGRGIGEDQIAAWNTRPESEPVTGKNDD